jgi:6-phosphogluconate dehydrogenase
MSYYGTIVRADHILSVRLWVVGSAMARNLLKSGAFKDVYVWNRSADKCSELVAEGAKTAGSAAEVVQACDITFACLSDPAAALACVESTGGVLDGISSGKVRVLSYRNLSFLKSNYYWRVEVVSWYGSDCERG